VEYLVIQLLDFVKLTLVAGLNLGLGYGLTVNSDELVHELLLLGFHLEESSVCVLFLALSCKNFSILFS
jgi:hypothetical protein